MVRHGVISMLALALATAAGAQSIISVKAGLLQFTRGPVLINNQPVFVRNTTASLVTLSPGEVLETKRLGFADIALTPAVFLRLGGNSSVRMEHNELSDTVLTLLSGVAIVECGEMMRDTAVRLLVNGIPVRFQKRGVYRLDQERGQIGTLEGEAVVADRKLKRNRMISLQELDVEPAKFEADRTDPLFLFAMFRSMANARTLGWRRPAPHTHLSCNTIWDACTPQAPMRLPQPDTGDGGALRGAR